MKRLFTNIDALLDQDEASPLERGTFDDALWVLLSGRITDPSQLDSYPHPVGVYLASRWLQWEVGNGGFAQAAYNIPEWFEMAAIGYAALGKPKAVALIKEALRMLSSERDTRRSARSSAISVKATWQRLTPGFPTMSGRSTKKESHTFERTGMPFAGSSDGMPFGEGRGGGGRTAWAKAPPTLHGLRGTSMRTLPTLHPIASIKCALL